MYLGKDCSLYTFPSEMPSLIDQSDQLLSSTDRTNQLIKSCDLRHVILLSGRFASAH
jgi:hypothetical protein